MALQPQQIRRRIVLGVTAAAALAFVPVALPHAAAPSAAAIGCSNATQVATWSLSQLANETISVPADATNLSSISSAARQGFGGVLLFGNTAPANFATQIAALRNSVPRHGGLLVMTDDEGGGVWRLANLIAPLPWAKTLAQDSPASISALVHSAALRMSKIGVTMDLAPVADVDGSHAYPGANNADGLRSFSGTTSVVSKDVLAYLKGFKGTNVVAVVKHFPGLGGVSPNTDDGAASTKSWSTVQATTLAPFVAAIHAGVSALMVANVKIPGLTNLPATLSPAVMSVLRNQLNFHGLIVTDSLSAGAITQAHFGVNSAAVASLAAGSDLILFGIPQNGATMALAHEISSNIVKAVAMGKISRAQLINAAILVVNAQHANLCG
jgi:beta-N-acetylhexosaminidase